MADQPIARTPFVEIALSLTKNNKPSKSPISKRFRRRSALRAESYRKLAAEQGLVGETFGEQKHLQNGELDDARNLMGGESEEDHPFHTRVRKAKRSCRLLSLKGNRRRWRLRGGK